MKELQIVFESIRAIEQFVQIATRYPGDIHVAEGHRILDGKAIMGLLSLGLNRKLQLSYAGNEVEFNELSQQINDYVI